MKLNKILTSSLAAGLLAAFSSSSAQAVTLIVGPSANLGDNVLFNVNGLEDNSTTVEGAVNGQIIDFSSTSVLTTPANGQARIEGLNGTYNNLLIDPEGSTLFSFLQFNVNAEQTGTIQFQVDGVNFEGAKPLGAGGQNFFTFKDGTFSTVSFTTSVGVGIGDVKQVRVSFGETPPRNVPEGGMTLALMGSSLLGLVALRKIAR